jgi:hypothetical protein
VAASGFAIMRFLRLRTTEELCVAALIIMWAILFSAVGHVWPWFMLWPLPFACVLWHRLIGRAYLLVAILTPVLNLAWLFAAGQALWLVGAGSLFFVTSAAAICALVVYERRRDHSVAAAAAASPAQRGAYSSS